MFRDPARRGGVRVVDTGDEVLDLVDHGARGRGRPLQAAVPPPEVVVHPAMVESDPRLPAGSETVHDPTVRRGACVEALRVAVLPSQFPVTVNLHEAVTLRAPVLAEHATGPFLRDLPTPRGPPDGLHRPTATLGARQCGRAASARISMSRAWSATNFFGLAFSF